MLGMGCCAHVLGLVSHGSMGVMIKSYEGSHKFLISVVCYESPERENLELDLGVFGYLDGVEDSVIRAPRISFVFVH